MESTGDTAVCPKCGYDRNSANLPAYLAAGTILNDRYIVGKLLHHNGESADYIAYDKTLACKILIKEYMPENLCVRDKNRLQLNAHHNHKVQYKALMDEFNELNRSVARMRTISHIIPVTDIFSANNTTYAVFEYIEGMSLLDFLKDNAGELTWEQVSRLFPPLFTTLSLIHNAGIVHRGISPETIFVTEKGELRLVSFSISALRTADTELNSELFHGYSAPEQYSLSGWQGTWTDVYGISAVLYRILTGCRPTEAQTRMSNDSLCSPHDINPNISERVSNTIMEGLALNSTDRIQTVTELVTKLFEENGEAEKITRTNTVTITVPRQNIEHKQHQQRQRTNHRERIAAAETISGAETISALDRVKVPLMIAFLLIAIFLVIGIICMAFFSESSENDIDLSIYSNTSSVDNVIEMTGTDDEFVTGITGDSDMPQLVGYKYDEIAESSTFLGWFVLEPKYEFNEKVAKGIITAQSIDAGEKFESGSTVVVVTVSRGPSKVEIPDYMLTSYSSYKYEDYFEMLEELGIEYNPMPEVNWGYADGYVIGISVDGKSVRGGDIINLEAGEVLDVRYTDNYKNEQTYYYKNTETDSDDDDENTKTETSKTPAWTTAQPVVTSKHYSTQATQTQSAVVTHSPQQTQAPETQPPVVTQVPEPVEPPTNDNNNGGDNADNNGGNDNNADAGNVDNAQ
jgi:serine/threonine-protein kinase